MLGGNKPGRFNSLCSVVLLLLGVQGGLARAGLPNDLLFDSGDSIVGWSTGSGNTRGADTEIKVLGRASLKSEGIARDRFRRLLTTSMDVSKYRYLAFWYYIDRPDLLSATTDQGQIELTSGFTFDTQEWSWSVRDLHLQRGWNYVLLDLPGRNTGDGIPINPQQVNYFRIYHRPVGSIVTRIDNIVFTNRPPKSFALAEFLEQKRIAASATAVEQEDDAFDFLQKTTAGGADRARACRRLTVELTQRQINAETLKGLGVSTAATFAEMQQRQYLKDVMCGSRAFPSRDVLIASRLQFAAADIAVINELATIFDLTMDAAAQTKQKLLDVDLRRIMSACSSKPEEVNRYIDTGAVATTFPGANVLVQQCSGTTLQIAGLLAPNAPVINDRRATYKQCMAVFEQQGAQCDNAYVNANDDYESALLRSKMSEAFREAARKQMKDSLDAIASITPADARAATGESTHGNPAHPEFNRLEQLHEQFDRHSGQIQYIEELIDHTTKNLVPTGTIDGKSVAAYMDAQTARAERLRAERVQYDNEQEDLAKQICFIDRNDKLCSAAVTSELPPSPPPAPPDQSRCAAMNINGLDSWFDKPLGRSGLGSQINEGDRIDHCLCELFDRNYSSKLPGDTVTQVGHCPAPEERIAQKCLENPYDGVDGVRKECMHLMQPISTDRETLGARLCAKINPGCNAPYMTEESKCGCGTRQPDGGILIPGRSTGIPNCDAVGGIPMANGGCQPFNSGANACAAGGKDFYGLRDPITDLKVRIFQDKIPGQVFLVPKAGRVSVITPPIKRSQLFTSRQLNVRALRLNPADDGTGQVKVYCKNSTFPGQSRIIETIALSTISTTTPTFMTINLDSAEVTACYRNDAASDVYFEFATDTKTNQQVAFFDILGELGSIKPLCINTPRPNSPTPGPRPLNFGLNSYTLGDGSTIALKFNGVGPMPPPAPQPPPANLPPLCVVDGIVVPCPR